jgi:lysyl-tRNA synthetase class 2
VACPGLDAHVDAVRSEDRFLITSPELAMKRLLVGGLSRVFQIARVYRAGELGAWHEPEFSLVEWYRAFAGMEDVLRDTEEIVLVAAQAVTGRPSVVAPDGRAILLRAPFDRMTIREAFREHAGISDAVDLAGSDESRYFQLYVDSVEPGVARHGAPVFLTEFPATQGALARRCDRDPTVVERFELFIGGVELCNGFGELTDPKEQRARFETEAERRQETGSRLQPIDERFLAALEEGMPPSGGNALGLDRLVALCLGARGIAETMAFPEER